MMISNNSYTSRILDECIEKVRTNYLQGLSVDEISAKINLSSIIVAGLIERYITKEHRDYDNEQE